MKKIVLSLILSVPFILSGQSSNGIIEEELAAISYQELVQEYNRTVSLESRNANIRGFDAYENRDFREAIRLWNEAIILDKKNHFAHFNSACAKSLLTAEDGRDRTDEILYHIRAAGEFSNFWILKAFTDPDLDSVRGEPVRRSIVFPAPGDFADDIYYYFYPDGTLTTGYGYPDLRGDPGDEEDWTPYSGPIAATEGYYFMIGETAVIYLPEGNPIDEFSFELMFPGEDPPVFFWIFLDLDQERYVDLEKEGYLR